jgi:AcrR family transcriptional regulator
VTDRQEPWIEYGYELFALHGPDGVKIEKLANLVSKSKSSFYHHFADTELFTGILLKRHLTQSEIIAKKEEKCSSVEGLVNLLVEHKLDLLFNRQLRIHRHVEILRSCFERAHEISMPAFQKVWSKVIELPEDSQLSSLVLHLAIENFYIQLTPENINREWLMSYFGRLIEMIDNVK